jgi:hypothetical protein
VFEEVVDSRTVYRLDRFASKRAEQVFLMLSGVIPLRQVIGFDPGKQFYSGRSMSLRVARVAGAQLIHRANVARIRNETLTPEDVEAQRVWNPVVDTRQVLCYHVAV